MNKAARSYNKTFFIIVFGVLSFVMLSNYIIDPLGRFRVKDKFYFSIERALKPKLLVSNSYTGLILGSSKITNMQTDKLGVNGDVLNAALSAAVPEELYYFLRDYQPDVKWIGIGLDFYMFNENSFPWRQSIDSDRGKTDFAYLVSYNTLEYSFRDMRNRLQGREVKYTRVGAENASYLEALDNGPCCDYSRNIGLLKTIHYKNFAISQRRLDMLRKIKAWAEQRNVSLFVWINPYNHAVSGLAEKMIPDQLRRLRQEIAGVFSHGNDRSVKEKQFIDLSMAYPDAKYYWKDDPYHYYPSTAELFFREHFTGIINEKFPGER